MPLHRDSPIRILAASAVAVSHTGTATETVLATIPVPAGTLGPRDALRITTLWTTTNSANNKTPRVRFGGGAGPVFLSPVLTTSVAFQSEILIRNRNALNAQVGFAAGTATAHGVSGNPNIFSAIDTAAAQDLVISGQLALGTETITLEAYLVEIIRG